jgi:hypothetical protein
VKVEIVAPDSVAGPAGWGSSAGFAWAECDGDGSHDGSEPCGAADDSCDADAAAAVVNVRHVVAATCGAGPYGVHSGSVSYGCGDCAMATWGDCAVWARLRGRVLVAGLWRCSFFSFSWS